MVSSLEKELMLLAADIRIGIVEALAHLGFGHVSGSLSIADLLAVLYGGVMRYDPQNPSWPQRDKLVCSKGHAGPAVYAVLALRGFFPYEQLFTLNAPGTQLPSHCDRRLAGVDMTTGSLGQGTSAAMGIALGDKLKGRDSRTFLIVGDGECDEGQVWEAAMFAAAKKLDNLYLFVDNNKKQLDGPVDDVLPSGDLAAKFAAFGFDAQRMDGHDVPGLHKAIAAAAHREGKPHAFVLDTVKGRGVPAIEAMDNNHSITLNAQQGKDYLDLLRAHRAQIAGGVSA